MSLLRLTARVLALPGNIPPAAATVVSARVAETESAWRAHMWGMSGTTRERRPTIRKRGTPPGSCSLRAFSTAQPLLIVALVFSRLLDLYGIGRRRRTLDCGGTNAKFGRDGLAWIGCEPSHVYRIDVCHYGSRCRLGMSRASSARGSRAESATIAPSTRPTWTKATCWGTMSRMTMS